MSGKSALSARPVSSRQEGRIAIVTNAGWDAVDAAASARKMIAGRAFRLVSDRPARKTNDAICVRQNRVVLASVADAKLSVANSTQPDQVSHQAGSDGDKNEFVAGESTA
jgi:hypothetical protein